MWLYQRECSPTSATHESFCSTRPSASASPHIVYRLVGGGGAIIIIINQSSFVGSQIACHIAIV